MSATVTLDNPSRTKIEVPAGNSYSVDKDGKLHIRTSPWGGDNCAVFKHWDHVVISPNRGPDGRFTKKG